MEEIINYTPVPCICSGLIRNKIEENDTFEVSIYDSPVGDLNGPIYVKEIFQPGHESNVKIGDRVKVLVTFTFGGVDNKFMDIYPNGSNYILGSFKENAISDLSVDNPVSEEDVDRIRFVNKKSGAGVIATDFGNIVMSTGGAIYSAGSPFGFGTNENFWKIMAQNHHRIISHNGPYYLSREHFGMFAGSDIEDKISRTSEDQIFLNYRRFVTQTRSPENWVSTCEGAFSPWLGPNNSSENVSIGRETLFTKIVNHGNSRATIEVGEPGSDFINVRIDDIKNSEKNLPIGSGATPAVVGNRFKMTVSDNGELEIRAAGKGIPKSNLNGFHMSVDADGNLKIHSSGNIELSHGDSDGSINSIKMDPNKGIDVTAKNGFRVNGNPVVNKNFLDWMKKYQTQLCLVTSLGGPAPIHPSALPEFTTGNIKPGEFNTNDIGSPASKIIKDPDSFSSL